MRRLRIIWPVLLLAFTLAACGDSTGPEVSVSGTWTYNASNLTDGDFTCSASGLRVSLTQSGDTFTGNTTGGTLRCLGSGGFDTGSVPLTTSQIASGRIDDNNVHFDIDTSDFHHSGRLSGNSISGTATMRLNAGGGQTTTLTGNFSMTR